MPLLRRRRPVLRAAVAGGAAYHMGKRAGARSEAAAPEPVQAAAPEPAQPPAQSAGMSPTAMQSLKELADLHERGVLTDAEFEQQKQVYLAQG